MTSAPDKSRPRTECSRALTRNKASYVSQPLKGEDTEICVQRFQIMEGSGFESTSSMFYRGPDPGFK